MRKTRGVWLIYDRKRLERSSGYCEMYINYFAQKSIPTKVFLVEENNFFEFESLASVIIMRTFRVDLTDFFQKNGATVFNNLQLALLGNNKWLAYNYVKDLGIDIPYTIITNKKEYKNIKYPFIAKSIFGHGGKEVFWVNNKEELENIKTKIKEEEFLIQKPVKSLGKDLRVYVVGRKIVASVLRYNPQDFRSNYSLGGQAKLYTLNEQEKTVVNTIISNLTIGMAGIDFIFEDNKLVFNEIEDIVGSRMLYAISDIDIVKIYVEHIINACFNNKHYF